MMNCGQELNGADFHPNPLFFEKRTEKSQEDFPKKNTALIFAAELSDGVMVAQQILVLFV
jgi:hypothetical protein